MKCISGTGGISGVSTNTRCGRGWGCSSLSDLAGSVAIKVAGPAGSAVDGRAGKQGMFDFLDTSLASFLVFLKNKKDMNLVTSSSLLTIAMSNTKTSVVGS